MSGQSNVGNAAVYQADDQRTVPDSEIEQQKKDNRFHEGKENSHKALDSSTFIPTPHTITPMYLGCHMSRHTTYNIPTYIPPYYFPLQQYVMSKYALVHKHMLMHSRGRALHRQQARARREA